MANPRNLAAGQIWVRVDPTKYHAHPKWVAARYRIRSVTGIDAVCDILDASGNPTGLRVMLPDSPLVRYESGPLPQTSLFDKEV